MTGDIDVEPLAFGGLPPGTARAAAQSLDLSRSRHIVYVGGNGEVLATFLDAWQQLAGVWLGPADAQGAACQFLRLRGLDDRVCYVAGDSLDDIPAGDLVVLNATGAAVDLSLQLLVSAGPQWLPAGGRWLILQRESPHLSSVVGPPLLQRQGLRVASYWPLAPGVQMLVCAPAHRFIGLLGDRSDRSVAWSPRP